MTRAAWITLGLIACAWKGAALLSGRARGDMRRFYSFRFGWTDPRLDAEWARFDGPESRWHLAANLIVEWCRMEPQRAAKTACALIVAALVLGALL